MKNNNWPVAAILTAPIAVMVFVWARSVGNPLDYLAHSVPPGQLLYVLSKLAGLLAFALLWAQCMLALAKRVRLLRAFPSLSLRRHLILGLATLAMCLGHLGLFFGAAWLRQGSAPWALLVPNFSAGYYKLHVSLGLLGLLALGLGVFAGWKSRRGHKGWRTLHMIWPLAFMLVFWHALAIGSESRYGAMLYVWWFIAASLGVTLISRLYGIYRNAGKSLAKPNALPSKAGLALDQEPPA